MNIVGGGGGGGLLLACEDLGRVFDNSFPVCAFFLKWRLDRTHTNSTSEIKISLQWLSKLRSLWPSVPWRVACELVSQQDPTLCPLSSSKPSLTSSIKGVCVFRCNLPPALLAEWLGSFMCHCGKKGVEWHQNKVQHMFTLEKKILLLHLPGFKLTSLAL